MKYRLGFPLLIVAVLAGIGIASAMGHKALPDTVLDFLNGKSLPSERADVANLAKDQPSRQGERRSSAGSGSGIDLPAGVFQDFFEVAQAGSLSDMTASLTFPQGSASSGSSTRGIGSGNGNSGNAPQGYSVHSGSFWNLSGGAGWTSGGSGSSAVAGSSAGSGGSGGGSSTNMPLSPPLVVASLMPGPDQGGNGDGVKDPASIDDPVILPQITQGPTPAFAPESDPVKGKPFQELLPDSKGQPNPDSDPLLGTPLKELLPDPKEQPNPEPAPVPNPEPGTLILGGLGMVVLAVAHRRMRRKQGE